MYATTVRLLRERGHEVHTLERDSRTLIGLRAKTTAFFQGIYSRRAKKAATALIASERPDIADLYNPYPLLSPSVVVACRESGVPVVMHCMNFRLICPVGIHLCRGTVCERCCGGREYWCVLKNCRDNMLESIGYALRIAVARKLRFYRDNVTLFVTPSECVRRHFLDAGFPEDRTLVIPNMTRIPDSAAAPSDGQYVAFAGRFSPEKGIGTLLQSARQVGYPVRLAGNPSAMPELVKSAPPNARFLGQMHGQQLVEFYRNARFVVVPSICFETCALVVIEAMTHGLPVIGSRIGGIPEQIDDGVTGLLFEPGNAEDLAEKMKLLWDNPDLCRQMGMAGREKAIREYSEDVYYTRLLDAYRKARKINTKVEGHYGARTTTD